MGKLPTQNREILKKLCLTLSLVDQNREVNKMSEKSLCIIFGPLLVFRAIDTYEQMKLYKDLQRVLGMLIRYFHEIFDSAPPALIIPNLMIEHALRNKRVIVAPAWRANAMSRFRGSMEKAWSEGR